MEGLQRSTTSFRRQGSSGLVWDDKFLAQLANQKPERDRDQDDQQQQPHDLDVKLETADLIKPPRPISTIERSRSTGGQRGYRTGRVSPAIEPPSPRVSACGFCGVFGKPAKNNHRKKAGKIRSR